MGYLKQRAENAKAEANYEQHEQIKVSDIQNLAFAIKRLVIKETKFGETAIIDLVLDSKPEEIRTCFCDKTIVLKQLKEALADGYKFDGDGLRYRLVQKPKSVGGYYWCVEEI